MYAIRSYYDSWKMTRFGQFPLGLGNRLYFDIHEPLKISDYTFEEIFEKTEKVIINNSYNFV